MAIPRMQIPPEHIPGFIKILSLSDQQVDELAAILDANPPSYEMATLLEYVVSKAQTISRDDANAIVPILFSLAELRYQTDLTTLDIATGICAALETAHSAELRERANECRDTKDRFLRLLSKQFIEVSAKAYKLLFEHQQTLVNAQIISDIRAIFNQEASTVGGAIIIHMLKLTYFETGARKEFFLALDYSDLKKLTSIIERAKEKDGILKALISKGGLSYISSE